MRSFVSGQVDFAFAQIGDLKVLVNIASKGETSYNPETHTVEEVGGSSNELLGVLEKTYSDLTTEGLPIQLRDYLFNKNDIDFEMRVGDSVTADGVTNPLYSFEDDGYTVLVTVSLK